MLYTSFHLISIDETKHTPPSFAFVRATYSLFQLVNQLICLFIYFFKWDGNHGPTNARLNKAAGGGKTGAWSAKANDIHQWIQVIFPGVTKLSGVAIQGRSDYHQWVTKFKVAYSLDGANFIAQNKVCCNVSDKSDYHRDDYSSQVHCYHKLFFSGFI